MTKLTDFNIPSMILTVRGVQVMLDSDLSLIYNVETRVFNQAVKRNIERFPEAFRFELTPDEYDNMRSQIVISNADDNALRSQSVILKKGGRGQHRKYLPYVFTEQGVAMLSAVIRSETAIKVSIKIINAFVEMRRFIQNNAEMFARLDSVERRQITFPELCRLVRKFRIQEIKEHASRKVTGIHLHHEHLASLFITNMSFMHLQELFPDLP